jgi:fibronectin-binding autotransporter adhesin
VTLSAGTLQAAADLTSVRGITISGGSTLNNGGFNDTFSGVIDGAGGLTLGAGTLLTTADLTSARGITISGGGTLDNGAQSTTFSGVTGGSHSNTFSGVIGGSGGQTLAGAGTTMLSGTNTYTDGTTVNGGTLVINRDG